MEDPRTLYLNDLNVFVKNSKTQLQRILSSLNWKEESLINKSQNEIKNESEDTESIYRDEITLPDGNNAGFDIVTTNWNPMAWQIVLRISNEPKDSEKLYNEIMASLPKNKSKENKEKTILEQLAAERDSKRRRISYKNKVHTKNKSHTEIIKEVIEQQMEAFNSWATPEELKEEATQAREEDKKTETKPKLIDLGLVGGNPHLAWQRVGSILKKKAEEEEYRKKRIESEKVKHWRERSSERSRSSGDKKRKRRHRSRSPEKTRSRERRKEDDSRRKSNQSEKNNHSREEEPERFNHKRKFDHEYVESESRRNFEHRKKSKYKSPEYKQHYK